MKICYWKTTVKDQIFHVQETASQMLSCEWFNASNINCLTFKVQENFSNQQPTNVMIDNRRLADYASVQQYY